MNSIRWRSDAVRSGDSPLTGRRPAYSSPSVWCPLNQKYLYIGPNYKIYRKPLSWNDTEIDKVRESRSNTESRSDRQKGF
jgi:hypothetical protein